MRAGAGAVQRPAPLAAELGALQDVVDPHAARDRREVALEVNGLRCVATGPAALQRAALRCNGLRCVATAIRPSVGLRGESAFWGCPAGALAAACRTTVPLRVRTRAGGRVRSVHSAEYRLELDVSRLLSALGERSLWELKSIRPSPPIPAPLSPHRARHSGAPPKAVRTVARAGGRHAPAVVYLNYIRRSSPPEYGAGPPAAARRVARAAGGGDALRVAADARARAVGGAVLTQYPPRHLSTRGGRARTERPVQRSAEMPPG